MEEKTQERVYGKQRKYVTSDEIAVVDCDVDDQETTLQINRNGSIVNGWSSDNVFLTKLKKIISTPNTPWKAWAGSKNSDGRITGYFFEGPKKMLTLRVKEREFTEEEKKERAKRFKSGKN